MHVRYDIILSRYYVFGERRYGATPRAARHFSLLIEISIIFPLLTLRFSLRYSAADAMLSASLSIITRDCWQSFSAFFFFFFFHAAIRFPRHIIVFSRLLAPLLLRRDAAGFAVEIVSLDTGC
jgi:hypothetical protein